MSYDKSDRLEKKYNVTKADGTPTDPDADYFVLNLRDDTHAWAAMFAYIKSIEDTSPEFAKELLTRVLDHVSVTLDKYKKML